jgi:hypothetical protein
MYKLLLTILLSLSFFIVACNTEEQIDTQDEYLESVPDMMMLNLSQDGQSSKLDGTQSTIREDQLNFFDGVNKLLSDTDDLVKNITSNVQPTDFTNNQGKKCRAWVFNGEKNNFALTVCNTRPLLKQYTYALFVRDLASTDDADYRILFAGFGTPQTRYLNTQKRGYGYIGYNFNNYKEFVGLNVEGYIGIAYRAVGIVRQVHIGLKDFKSSEQTQAYTALYRYKHVVGMGGVLKYLTEYDFLSKDENQNIILGEDGLKEAARRVSVWSTNGQARVATLVCNGTLGQDQCLFHAHCWGTDGNITYDDVADPESEITWKSCGEITLTTDLDSYKDKDFELEDTSDEETGAPSLEVPTEDVNE